MEDVEAKAAINDLIKAGAALTAIRKRLNLKVHACSHCEAERFDSWGDKQIDNHLNGAIGRIERAAKEISDQFGWDWRDRVEWRVKRDARRK